MRRLNPFSLNFVLAGALALGACGSPAEEIKPPVEDEEEQTETFPEIDVAGVAEVHPAALAWYALQDPQPELPTVAGRKLAIDEPFLVLSKSANSRLKEVEALPADGAWKVEKVPTKPVVFGLIAAVLDERAPAERRFITSASTVWEGRPVANVAGVKAYALPVDFMKHLSGLIELVEDTDLETQGFMFGLVLDKDGKPVADASVSGNGIKPENVHYFDAGFTRKEGDKTSANGTFVILGATGVELYKIAGRPEFPSRKAGSSPGSVFQLVFQAK